jgi:prevent-host-death family protein
MPTRFSEDVIPLSDLKVNPGKIVNQTRDNRRPVLVTSHGRGVAVMQSLQDYEAAEDERALLKAIAQGMSDVQQGDTVTLEEARQQLGLSSD